MNVCDFGYEGVSHALANAGLRIRTGPLVIDLRSRLPAIARGLALHYGGHPVEDASGFADFHITVDRPHSLRRWIAVQALFQLDGAAPFRPLPVEQAFPLLEWGLNWCITSMCHHFVAIHAAVVEKDGHVLLLPAPPGSGKSTLCAALVNRGWRLFSDELALIDPETGVVVPLARPVGLKNESIHVIKKFAQDAVLGPAVKDTIKGVVAHMKPPTASVARAAETAYARWIVLPRYAAGAAANLIEIPKAEAFMQLTENTFNHDLHGRTGFDTLARVIDGSDCYSFTYSRLEEACAIFEDLSRRA